MIGLIFNVYFSLLTFQGIVTLVGILILFLLMISDKGGNE